MWLVIFLSASIAGCVFAELEGDHVCPEQERYLVNVTRTVLRTYKIRNYKWCMNVPPRCSYYTDEEKYVPETVEQEELRIVKKCCQGYQEDENGEKCITYCPNCIHGECELNNKCNCHPGYWGENCDIGCSTTRWGRNCEFDCICKRGDCDPVSGYCICPPGWKGNRCEESPLVTTTSTTTTKTSSSINPMTTEHQIPNITDTANLEKNRKTTPERTKYPIFQKYYTFYITTQIPLLTTELKPERQNEVGTWQPPEISFPTEKTSVPIEPFPNTNPTTLTWLSSENPEETTTYNHIKSSSINSEQKSGNSKSQPSTEVDTVPVPVAHMTKNFYEDDEAKQEQELVNNTITDQVVSVTQTNHANLKAKVEDSLQVSITSTQPIFAREENWPNDESHVDLENDSPIHQNHAPIKDANMVFSIGAAAGVTATIILIVGVALLTTQSYRKKKTDSIVSVSTTKSNNEHGDARGGPAVSIYTRSVFHAPLPEPPVFENPVFTTPIEYENNLSEFGSGGTLETHVICSMHLPNNHPNYKRDSRSVDAFYDHPPSTGSYRAASIPEPPEHSLEVANGEVKEHLYDEIPCWKQPLPIKQPPNVLSTEALSYYANTSTRL